MIRSTTTTTTTTAVMMMMVAVILSSILLVSAATGGVEEGRVFETTNNNNKNLPHHNNNQQEDNIIGLHRYYHNHLRTNVVRKLQQQQLLLVEEEEGNNDGRKLNNDFGGGAAGDFLCTALTGDIVQAGLLPSTLVVNCTTTDGFGKLTLMFEDTNTEPTCDTITDSEGIEVEQCIQNLEMEISIDLLSSSGGGDVDSAGTSMTINMCVTLVSGFPTDIIGINFCFGIDGEVVITNNAGIGGGDGTTTVPADGLDDAFHIESCTATSSSTTISSSSDNTIVDCNCQVCLEGDGVTFDCGNSLVVKDCSEFDGIEDFTTTGGTTVVNQLLESDTSEKTTTDNEYKGNENGNNNNNDDSGGVGVGGTSRTVSSSFLVVVVVAMSVVVAAII